MIRSHRLCTRVLHWDPDTLVQRKMHDIRKFTPFVEFCLSEKLTKRDWICALTLLSRKHKGDLKSRLFKDFQKALLRQEFSASTLILVLHRLTLLNLSSTFTLHLPKLMEYLPEYKGPRNISLIGWMLTRMEIEDKEVWRLWGFKAEEVLDSKSFKRADQALLSWTFQKSPPGLTSPWLASKLLQISQDLEIALDSEPVMAPHDFAMFFSVYSRLASNHESLLQKMQAYLVTHHRALVFEPSGLASLFKHVAIDKPRHSLVLDVLCEYARGLRLSFTLNEYHVLDILRAVKSLNLRDDRVTYMANTYISSHGRHIRMPPLISITKLLISMGIHNPTSIKEIFVGLEKKGYELSLRDLVALRNLFIESNLATQRVIGILSVFIKTREDEAAYGPS